MNKKTLNTISIELEHQCLKHGGYSAFARLISTDECIVSPQQLKHWRNGREIPEKYCLLIEKNTGVKCEFWRPDVQWSIIRCKTKGKK